MTSVEAGRAAGRPRVSREPLTRGERLVLTMGFAVMILGVMGLVGIIFACNSFSREFGGSRPEVHEQIDGRPAEDSDPQEPAGP